jgi:ATP/maltotriose-dependent transcriptional regulator MalT
MTHRSPELVRDAGASPQQAGNSDTELKNYVTSILQKLGVRDRTQAAVRTRELGMI